MTGNHLHIVKVLSGIEFSIAITNFGQDFINMIDQRGCGLGQVILMELLFRIGISRPMGLIKLLLSIPILLSQQGIEHDIPDLFRDATTFRIKDHGRIIESHINQILSHHFQIWKQFAIGGGWRGIVKPIGCQESTGIGRVCIALQVNVTSTRGGIMRRERNRIQQWSDGGGKRGTGTYDRSI